jgi:hypothetical protein
MDNGNFYHTTAKQEQTYTDLVSEVADTLIREFEYFGNVSPRIEDPKNRRQTNLISYQKHITTEAKVVGIRNFYTDKKHINIQLYIEVKQNFKEGVSYDILQNTYCLRHDIFYLSPIIKYDIFLSEKIGTGGHKYTRKDDVIMFHTGKTIPITITDFEDFSFCKIKNLTVDYRELIFPKSSINQHSKKFNIYLSPSAYKFIGDIYNVNKGYTKGTNGNFLRMLYLSASAITTLGLGDIYPISNWARFLIILESIIGVVVISMGINYLFQEASITRE